MSSSPQWRREPDDVRERLAEIGGLTVEVLHEVAAQGEIGRASCTVNHPRLAAPLMAYFDATRALRDLLLPLGWTKRNDGGSELTVSPDGQHAIVVAAGDENTGSVICQPKTKSPKGPRTREAIALNAVQLSFLAALGLGETEHEPRLRRVESAASFTWVLLICPAENALRIELSLPVYIGEDGRPEHFAERIILPPLDLSGGLSLGGLGPETGPDFDIDITPFE